MEREIGGTMPVNVTIFGYIWCFRVTRRIAFPGFANRSRS